MCPYTHLYNTRKNTQGVHGKQKGSAVNNKSQCNSKIK